MPDSRQLLHQLDAEYNELKRQEKEATEGQEQIRNKLAEVSDELKKYHTAITKNLDHFAEVTKEGFDESKKQIGANAARIMNLVEEEDMKLHYNNYREVKTQVFINDCPFMHFCDRSCRFIC